MKITILTSETIKIGQQVSFMLSGGYKSGIVTSLLDLNNVNIHYEIKDLSINEITHHIAERDLIKGEIFILK